MKISNPKLLVQSAAALALVALCSSAFAASTWNLDALCTSNSSSVIGGSCGGSLAVSGWSTGTGSPASPTVGTTFQAATVYDWGTNGVGVVAVNENSGVGGPHAMDNGYGIDALLLNFSGGAVNLNSLQIGWNGYDNPTTSDNNGGSSGGGTAVNYNDSDLSVLAWTKANTPAPTMAGATLSTLLTSGWSLVGNYANVGTMSGNTQSPITSAIYSSYWLISAYSTSYGTGTSLDQGNDAFKVLAIAGNTCSGTVTNNACGGSKVPEPGSFALMGVALMGFVASRRSKRKAA